MLETVAESVAFRGSDTSARTGACDLITDFQLRMFYAHIMKQPDRNYISISSKEVPTGLPGDTSLFMDPSWSLMRLPLMPSHPTEPHERVAERVHRGFRLPPGGLVLGAAEKGVDVTRIFMRNVVPPAARPPGSSGGGGGGGSTGAPAPPASKRRAGGGDVSGSDHGQQVSGDTTGYSHDSKRQRSNY